MYSFSSNRRFVILSYENSHGLLLLSSKKEGNAIPTRIDILFKDVRAMDVRVFMSEITIAEVSVEVGANFQSLPNKMAEPGLRLYLLNGGDWKGYVFAGMVWTHEDDRRQNEASYFSAFSPRLRINK